MRTEKLRQIRELATKEKPGPTALDLWMQCHTQQEALFYLIWHHMTGKSITKGDDPAEIMPFYRDAVHYELIRYSYSPGDELNQHSSEGKTKFCTYWLPTNTLIFYDKSINKVLNINNLKDISNEKDNK